MITLIPQSITGPSWQPVEITADITFEVAVKQSTLGDQLRALSDLETNSSCEYWLRSHIVDWRGVVDESGISVPFSSQQLEMLCIAYPSAVMQLMSAVHSGLMQEPHSKNSEPPPFAGGTETNIETISSTPSSKSSGTSEESPKSAEALG